MNRTFKIVFMLAMILLDRAILSKFQIMSVVPCYVLAAALAVAVRDSQPDSVIISAGAGVVIDLLSSSIFGMNTLLFLYLALICSMCAETLYMKKLKIIVPMAFVALFLYEILFGVLCCLIRNTLFMPEMVLSTVLPSAFFGTVLFALIYVALGRVHIEKKIRGIKYEQQI